MLAYIYRRMSYDNHWIQCTGSDSAVHNHSQYNLCQIFRSSQSCDRFSHHKPQNTVGVKWKERFISNIARTNVLLMFIRLNVFPFKLFNGVNLHGYKYILGGGKMKLKERSKPYLYPWKKNYHYYHHFGCHGENKNSKKLKKNRKTSLNDHARERAF